MQLELKHAKSIYPAGSQTPDRAAQYSPVSICNYPGVLRAVCVGPFQVRLEPGELARYVVTVGKEGLRAVGQHVRVLNVPRVPHVPAMAVGPSGHGEAITVVLKRKTIQIY